jgi:prepilin-type processing-associated H-X9-DG protein
VTNFGAFSSRLTPVPSPVDPILNSGGSMTGRRAYAWADADAAANGVSGPSNAISPGSRIAKVNNYSTPTGGPPECRWSVNNCGPNDEPFAFHTGGVNATLGDGSVRFITQGIDAIVLKNLSGANDGKIEAMPGE